MYRQRRDIFVPDLHLPDHDYDHDHDYAVDTAATMCREWRELDDIRVLASTKLSERTALVSAGQCQRIMR